MSKKIETHKNILAIYIYKENFSPVGLPRTKTRYKMQRSVFGRALPMDSDSDCRKYRQTDTRRDHRQADRRTDASRRALIAQAIAAPVPLDVGCEILSSRLGSLHGPEPEPEGTTQVTKYTRPRYLVANLRIANSRFLTKGRLPGLSKLRTHHRARYQAPQEKRARILWCVPLLARGG